MASHDEPPDPRRGQAASDSERGPSEQGRFGRLG
jgi:hypothetical protein